MLEHTSDYLQKVSTANREGASLIVFNALRLMQQYPGKQIDEICQELRVSGRQFRRVFGEKAGMSPKYFLQIVRLHKAAALAQSTSDTDFQQIIHECGYYDQSHFARDIKRFTGKSPKQFFQHEA